MDLDAEFVALGYRYRWSVELFFRWLISLWTGRKPTKRTFEMVYFYFSGMASEEELLAHIAKLKPHDG